MSANLLAQETSPYLLQHKDNPVHWMPWGEAALERARAEGKPILLSIGYAACHWCHVMAHESFEDARVAALMNQHFVSVKVDREERPDLDSVYQTALALMGEQGGWPLTMFLTPEAVPFWGGTYFPPAPRFGRPGFAQVLAHVAETWRGRREKVREGADSVRDALAKVSGPRAGEVRPQMIDAAATAALGHVDPVSGGTLGAPKFPQPSLFRLLWRTHLRTGSALYREAVTLTLDRICQGGIYDHLGGGFARYSTDDRWLVPHFEKMLYDNAQLVELLTEVWLGTRSPLYAARVAETVAWMLDEMRTGPDGAGAAFASSFDADSEGEEGRYYAWDEAEIDAVLGADSAAFKAAYDVSRQGNWEGRTILNRSGAPRLGDAAHEAALAGARSRLLARRRKRVPPMRDDKVLADWNGLAIAALAFAGQAFARPEWIHAAEAAYAFVRANMIVDGRLRHAWRAGRARHPAVIEDLANLARASLALHEATGRGDYLDHARAFVAEADRHHGDEAGPGSPPGSPLARGGGGYVQGADDSGFALARTRPVHDNATPAGNGTMAEVLARLALVTGEDAHRRRAEAVVAAFAGTPPEHLAAAATLVMAYETLERAVQVAIVGDGGDEATRALLRAAHESPAAPKVIVTVTPGRELPPGHPAHGKGLVNGRAAAYVCLGPVCSLPVTTPEALAERMSAR